MPTIDAVERPDRAPIGAGTSLVSTKLTPPVPRALVPRPHLIERLLAGSDRRATLISAQAGAEVLPGSRIGADAEQVQADLHGLDDLERREQADAA